MARKKVARRRAAPVDDEPIFDGEVEQAVRDAALSWYHHNQISTNILRTYFIEYAKNIDPAIVPAVKAAQLWVSPAWGSVARMLSRGLVDEDWKRRTDGRVIEIVQKGNEILA